MTQGKYYLAAAVITTVTVWLLASNSDRIISEMSPVTKEVLKNFRNSISVLDFGARSEYSNIKACNWPPPLYGKPNRSSNPGSILGMSKLQKWAEKHRSDSVLYLQSGGLLGLYRDGVLIPGDSDIDVRYGFKNTVSKSDKSELFKLQTGLLSLNSLWEYGDPWNSFLIILKNTVTDNVIEELQRSICLPDRSPLQTHSHTRGELEFTYGPQWFIKMPWKAMLPDQFVLWANPRNNWHHNWKQSMDVIRQIDKDQDDKITAKEIDIYVMKDGINFEQYNTQILPRDRCRAAAMLTFLRSFDQSPHPIKDDDLRHWHTNHTLFAFPDCDKL